MDFQGTVPGLGAAPQVLTVESWADVAQKDATAGDGDSGGLMGRERQQGGVVCGGNNRRADTASSFLGPELQAESRADVAQEGATADSGTIGGIDGRRAAAGRSDSAGGTGAASCFPGLEL